MPAQAEALERGLDHRPVRVVGDDAEPVRARKLRNDLGCMIEQPRALHDFAPERVGHPSECRAIGNLAQPRERQREREAVIEAVLALRFPGARDLRAAGRMVVLDEHADR